MNKTTIYYCELFLINFIISLLAITSKLNQHLSNPLAKSGGISSVSRGTLQDIYFMQR